MDILKGYAIIIVVLGHCIQAVYSDWSRLDAEKIIIMFHMPLFMAISGYFAASSLKKYTITELIKKRFIQLMLPSLSIGLINVMIIGGSKIIKGKILELDYFCELMFTGLWFLTTLFVLYFIAAVLQRYIKSKYRIIAWLMIYIVLYFLPDIWVFNNLEFLCPFFVIGMKTSSLKWEKTNIWMFLGALIVFICCFQYYDFSYSLYAMGDDCLNTDYLNKTILRLMSGMSGCIISLYLIKIVSSIKVPKLISCIATLGTLTLPIYVLHQKFLTPFRFISLGQCNIAILILITIADVLISIWVYKLLRKNKYVALLLFGERSRNN